MATADAAFLERRLELRSGFSFRFPDADTVLVWSSSAQRADVSLRDPSGSGWLSGLFSRLDGERSLREALDVVPKSDHERARALISALQRSCLRERVVGASQPLPAWLAAYLGDRTTSVGAFVEAFRTSRIAIVGDGVLANAVEQNLRLLDAPFAEIRREAFGANDVDDANLSILAMDTYDVATMRTMDRLCRARETRWLLCVVDGWRLTLGPCFIAGESACVECALGAIREGAHDIGPSYAEVAPQHARLVNPVFANLLAALVVTDLPNLVGSIPFDLERASSLTIGHALTLDLRGYDASLTRIHRRPSCATCAPGEPQC